jgi:nitrile hydratase accessory protein
LSEPRPAAELPLAGPAAPPRANGELVFAAPWESRVFGIAMSLVETGRITWAEFQRELVASIGAWEASAAAGSEYRYYERWQEALERVVARQALCPARELDARAGELAARPHGHDHRH